MELEIRQKGKLALQYILKQEQNIITIEKNIALIAQDSDDIYKTILYQTIKDIKDGIKLNLVLKNIKKNKIHYNHYSNDDYIFEEQEQDNFIIQPFEVYEGVITCNCGSSRVYSYQKQSRSADEPMSTYATCMKCKNKWVYSG